MTQPNARRCEMCEQVRDDVAPARAKVHGLVPLCPPCFQLADARGALTSDQPEAWRRSSDA